MAELGYFGNARDAEEEAVLIAQALVRIDTRNTEREAVKFCQRLLEEAGYRTKVIAPPDEPQHPNLIAWIPGEGDENDALLVHGHLDTVDVAEGEWTHDPFAGVITKDANNEGYLHGLGAIDNKGPIAATIAALRRLKREGVKPQRHIRLALFAREERENPGSRFLIQHHPEVFKGVTEVQGLEVGGFSVDLAGDRFYIFQLGESGDTHVRVVLDSILTGHNLDGLGGGVHSAMVDQNPLIIPAADLMRAIQTATTENHWGGVLPPTTAMALRQLGSHMGIHVNLKNPLPFLAEVRQHNSMFADLLRASTQHVIQPTVLNGMSTLSRTPTQLEIQVTLRPMPGQYYHALQALKELISRTELKWRQAGHQVKATVEFEREGLDGYSSVPNGRAAGAMKAAILHQDPTAQILELNYPFGTDNKNLTPLKCASYTGNCPLKLPPTYRPLEWYHRRNENVPTSALQFATTTLTIGFQPSLVSDRPGTGLGLRPGGIQDPKLLDAQHAVAMERFRRSRGPRIAA